jgi:DNA topoisomerase-3
MSRWGDCDPLLLFDAPCLARVKPENENIVKNLTDEAKKVGMLILWLDCDREGENIAFEVIDICKKAKASLTIKRAKFSAVNEREVLRAINNLAEPNKLLSDAVDARSEIDLRSGYAFTRLQTDMLRDKYNLDVRVVSYGTCQFPTLGFVVERYNQRENFIAEKFWSIEVTHSKGEEEIVHATFHWARERLYDLVATAAFAAIIHTDPQAMVVEMKRNPKYRYRPTPLSTVELQKRGSQYLRIAPEAVMTAAESLYMKGIISYPRTETEIFKEGIDITALITELTQSPDFGGYAASLLNDGKFQFPKNGTKDDEAHPPIHPVKSVPLSSLNGDEQKIYELVVRHFLACCSKDGLGSQTTVMIDIAGELFKATGLMIHEKNYLDVYRYENWTGTKIPYYTEGEVFAPSSISMKEGKTQAPPALTYHDLISLMDKHGIGTDATIAEHIKTIQDRSYVSMENNVFTPSKLGRALHASYDKLGFFLLKPALRAAIEDGCKAISVGEKLKAVVVADCMATLKDTFIKTRQQLLGIQSTFAEYYGDTTMDMSDFVTRSNSFSRCGVCNSKMALKEKREGVETKKRLLWCAVCKKQHLLGPRGDLQATNNVCPLCQFQVLSIDYGKGTPYNLCPYCYKNHPPNFRGTKDMLCKDCPAKCGLAGGSEVDGLVLGKCENPVCIGAHDVVLKKKNGSFNLSCTAMTNSGSVCRNSVWLPKSVTRISPPLNSFCSKCKSPKVTIFLKPGSVPGTDPGSEMKHILCLICSDDFMKEELEYKGMMKKPVTRTAGGGTAPSRVLTDSFNQLASNLPATSLGTSVSSFGSAIATGKMSKQKSSTAKASSKSTSSTKPSSQSHGSFHMCCGKKVPIRTVGKDGPNRGRPFSKCDGCGKFTWHDEGGSAANAAPAPSRNGNAGGHGECFSFKKNGNCDKGMACRYSH